MCINILINNVHSFILQVKRESGLNPFSELQIVLRFIQMVFIFALTLGKTKWDIFYPRGMIITLIIPTILLRMAAS